MAAVTRRLNLLAMLPDDATPLGAPEDGTATAGLDPSPGPAISLTIEPWEVDLGDLLLEHPYARVAHMGYVGGQWIYLDSDRVLIAARGIGELVDVVRVDGP